ncbi:MAG TPA: PadR family transcriptional regulator [Clostridia bacterium]
MKIPFYILGLLLRYGPQHGYRLKQIIEETVSDFAKIKLPTIYYHLLKLKEKGYVTDTLDKEGNRPEKLVYSITPSGSEFYNSLFYKQLSETYSPEFTLDGVLYFKDTISNEDLKKALSIKKQELQRTIENVAKHKEITLNHIHEHGKFSTESVFDHHLMHLEAEYRWLEKTIEGL